MKHNVYTVYAKELKKQLLKDDINRLKVYGDDGTCVEYVKLSQAQSEQSKIIRCKNCHYWQKNTVRQNSNDAGLWNEALCERHTIYGNEPHEAWTSSDWYCADGERI